MFVIFKYFQIDHVQNFDIQIFTNFQVYIYVSHQNKQGDKHEGEKLCKK